VIGDPNSPSADLLAGWLAARLDVPVRRGRSTSGGGIASVELARKSGNVLLSRPDGRVGTLTQPGQPPRRVALQRRAVAECLAEELRRLDADEIYESALMSLDKVVRSRASVKPATEAKPNGRAKADA
jgi:glucose-6-phosphate dehydrogenase assembly protein OpcA